MPAQPDGPRARQLAQAGQDGRERLERTHRAREEALTACRATIQACGRAIRAIHRRRPEDYHALVSQAETALRRAQRALAPHPAVAASGFLHDAEKEYAEARLTAFLVAGADSGGDSASLAGSSDEITLPDAGALGVGLPAWFNGMAEAASELRRHLLDRLRQGELAVAEELLLAMEDVYDLLVTVDYPDAVTGGLRRSTDALRAVLERSRADLTMTLVQARLQAALERGAGGTSMPG